MKKLVTLTSVTVALAVSSASAQTVLFQDDFSTSSAPDAMPSSQHAGQVNPGPLADTANWNVYRANTDTISATKYIEVTSANSPFGESNPYLRLHYESGAGSLWTTASNNFTEASTVVTVSFNFFRPSTTSWDGSNASETDPHFRLGISDPVGSNNSRVPHVLRFFGDGSVGATTGSATANAYSLDTVHAVSWVYNHSSSAASYAGSAMSLAASSYDLWIDGVRVITGAGGPGANLALDTPLTSLGFASFATAEFMVDDVVVQSGAIPEPSTYALGAGLLALGGAFFWRRRTARG